MEMAKVTSKGQITIPVSIRRRLCIEEGDKLLFIDSPDGVIMVNPNLLQGEKDNENQFEETGNSSSPATATQKKKANESEPSLNKSATSSSVTSASKVSPPPGAISHSSGTTSSPAVSPPPKAASLTSATSAPENAKSSSRVTQPYHNVTLTSNAVPQSANAVNPGAQQVKGLDISALLDEIRSIGSKI